MRASPRALLAILGGLTGAAAAAMPAAAESEVDTVLFGSLDAGSANFLSLGAKYVPDGIGREGWLVSGSLGYGARFERDRSAPEVAYGLKPPQAVRHTALASVMAGYQWVFDWGVAALFAGPELSYEVFAAPSTRRWPAPRFGARVQGELWVRPTQQTLLTATLVAGSARPDMWGRVSWGMRLPALAATWLADTYLGPEAGLYADADPYRKWSLGLHATAFTLADYSFRLSAGWLREEPIGRDGGYLALAVWTHL